ncbi:MAG: DHHA1 domain-containing protein [Candidatus Hydrothermarchaeota archaeon]
MNRKHFNRLLKTLRTALHELKRQREVKVLSHCDADGIAASAILINVLRNLNIDYSVEFLKSSGEVDLKKYSEFVVATDLNIDPNLNSIVFDHHYTLNQGVINPFNFGFSGSEEISASGLLGLFSYLQSRENSRFFSLSILGAIGDRQDRNGKLIGLNRWFLKKGCERGVVQEEKDIRLYGKETKKIANLLCYSSDPFIPGMTGNIKSCFSFLSSIGIRNKRWSELTLHEKRRLITKLVYLMFKSNVPVDTTKNLIGYVYTFPNEPKGSELRDAKEFSTLLNATARTDHPEVGLSVCLGDREKDLLFARKLLDLYRTQIIDGLNYIRKKDPIVHGNLQYFYARDKIKDTMIGTILGIAVSSGILPDDRVNLGLANTDNSKIKVSARISPQMNINLASALYSAAKLVGGSGGGHNVAAGAIIPKGEEENFIYNLESIITSNLFSKS